MNNKILLAKSLNIPKFFNVLSTISITFHYNLKNNFL